MRIETVSGAQFSYRWVFIDTVDGRNNRTLYIIHRFPSPQSSMLLLERSGWAKGLQNRTRLKQKLYLYIPTLKFGVRGSLVYVYHVFDFSVHQLNGRSCIYIFEHWNLGCGVPAPRFQNILVSLILWDELRIMTTRLSRLFLPGVESCWGLAFDPVSSFKLELGGRGDCQQLKINFDHGNLGGAGGIGFCFQDTKKLSLSFPRWGSAIWHCL